MRNGVELVDVIDNYCKSEGISRRQFCVDTDIPTSTIASWKSCNLLPTAEILFKVASRMGVSMDYLLTGENFFFDDNEKEIYNKGFADGIKYFKSLVLKLN